MALGHRGLVGERQGGERQERHNEAKMGGNGVIDRLQLFHNSFFSYMLFIYLKERECVHTCAHVGGGHKGQRQR